MTTEDDFQCALDRNPGDWQTRLVSVDWLQEHGDPRAGMRRVQPTKGNHPKAKAHSRVIDSELKLLVYSFGPQAETICAAANDGAGWCRYSLPAAPPSRSPISPPIAAPNCSAPRWSPKKCAPVRPQQIKVASRV